MNEFSEAEKKELLATAHDLRNVADESLTLLAEENARLVTRLAEAEQARDAARDAAFAEGIRSGAIERELAARLPKVCPICTVTPYACPACEDYVPRSDLAAAETRRDFLEADAELRERAVVSYMNMLHDANAERDAHLADLRAAEQRGRALLAVARAVHDRSGYPCRICGRIRHPAGCDCPMAALDAAYPGWRVEWRHGRPHDARMAEDHDEA